MSSKKKQKKKKSDFVKTIHLCEYDKWTAISRELKEFIFYSLNDNFRDQLYLIYNDVAKGLVSGCGTTPVCIWVRVFMFNYGRGTLNMQLLVLINIKDLNICEALQ